jgi:succinoglycan biosynthesis transport protein ExoP
MDNFKAPDAADSKLHFLDYWRIIRIRKTVIIAVFLLVVITTTVVTYMLPETFMSSTRIKVEKETSDIPLLGQVTMSGPPDPFFLQTEFEVIQSKTNLYRVIDELNLNTEWSKEYLRQGTLKTVETFDLLRDKIDVRQYRNTTMIEIRVYSRNKAEAARIANKIAEVYRESRLSERENMAARGIEKVTSSLREQQSKVLALQGELDRIRETNRITEVNFDSWSQGTLEAQAVQRTDLLKTEVESKLIRVQSTLDRLTGLSKDQLRDVLPTLYRDEPLLIDALQKEVDARQQMVRLTTSLAEDHPEVKGVQKLLDQVSRDVDKRINGIMVGLNLQVEAHQKELQGLSNRVALAKDEDLRRTTGYREYFTKKRQLENEKIMADVLSRKLAQETFDKAIPRQSLVMITDMAEEGLKPVKPNIPLNIAFGVVVGLVVGIGLAFFIEYLDTSVKTIDDVERTLQAPVLGVIPQNVGSLLEEGPDSPHAEAYRVLRTNILFTRKDETFNTVTIVSGGAGEGKSTTLFNLAVIFAQNGHRVLVIDSDLRRPSMHKFFKVSNSMGLTNYLLGQNKLEEVIQTSSLSTLDFLPSGKLPSSSMGILSSQQMKDLIGEVKRRYDFVFFDSPPIMGVSDAVVLASEVDISLQVIQYRKYPQAMTIRAKQMVSKVGGYLVGIVLNNINMSQDENYYYYSGYYYDYYQSYNSRDKDKDDSGKGDSKDEPKKNGSGDGSRIELKKKY